MLAGEQQWLGVILLFCCAMIGAGLMQMMVSDV
jgi:hypothetical protein